MPSSTNRTPTDDLLDALAYAHKDPGLPADVRLFAGQLLIDYFKALL